MVFEDFSYFSLITVLVYSTLLFSNHGANIRRCRCVENVLLEDSAGEMKNMCKAMTSSKNEEFLAYGLVLSNNLLSSIEKDSTFKVRNHTEDIVPKYSESNFIMHFRLQKKVAKQLVMKFQDTEICKSLQGNGGCPIISPEKHIVTYLWFVGYQSSSYRDVADRFGIRL